MDINENQLNEQKRIALVNETYEGKIYDPVILKLAFAGFLIGGVLIGFLFYLFSNGAIPLKGFGQLTASGNAPTTFFGFGIGSAIGGLIGGIVGLLKLPLISKKL